jgi:hypothetical protein
VPVLTAPGRVIATAASHCPGIENRGLTTVKLGQKSGFQALSAILFLILHAEADQRLAATVKGAFRNTH